jgi:hypothetical protein
MVTYGEQDVVKCTKSSNQKVRVPLKGANPCRLATLMDETLIDWPRDCTGALATHK